MLACPKCSEQRCLPERAIKGPRRFTKATRANKLVPKRTVMKVHWIKPGLCKAPIIIISKNARGTNLA